MSAQLPLSKLPPHLAHHEAQGLADPTSAIAQFHIGDYRNFVYLVLDARSKQALIVDPQEDLSEPLAALADHGFTLRGCLLTHTHFDHIAGLPALVTQQPEMPVFVHEGDQHRLPAPIRAKARLVSIRDGELLSGPDLLPGLSLRVIHTPGHSAGECSYLIEATGQPPYLLTGDTLFIRDCGRTDFPDGSNEQMFASLQRIRALAPETVILPGHHYQKETASTLDRELRESPPLRCESVEELAQLP
jgi:glyoxylase-like metal-dependent hydrolase (beta-lactamase superfamily II)